MFRCGFVDKHVENISMDIVELMLVTIPLSQGPGIRISHTLSQLPGILIPATLIRYPSYVFWDTDRGYLGYRIRVAGIPICVIFTMKNPYPSDLGYLSQLP